MAVPVSVALSYFEYQVDFEAPELRMLVDRGSFVEAMFQVLKAWGMCIDDIESRTGGKTSEQGVAYKIPLKRISIFCGPSYCKFTKDDANWEGAEETLSILKAALGVLRAEFAISFGLQKTLIALHLQVNSGTFLDVLRPFVVPALAGIEKTPIRTLAAIAKWENRKVTIDGSGALANAVFLRFERDFDKDAGLNAMAEQLYNDEKQLFNMLGVEEKQQ
jgi:hypothetical protein